tara:strand:+ start:1546 stop:1791 length:246 start_codon:yes stop_codon:yes gene_type:complete
MYSASWCAPCKFAKKLLDNLNLSYEEIDIEKNNISREQLLEMTGGYTVPQIQINEKYIGGYSELMQLNQSGKLKEIISNGN